MKKIIIPVTTDNGKLKMIEALKQIKAYTKDITFPNMPLEKISLSMLTLAEDSKKKCIHVLFNGTEWDCNLNTWIKGNSELTFATIG